MSDLRPVNYDSNIFNNENVNDLSGNNDLSNTLTDRPFPYNSQDLKEFSDNEDSPSNLNNTNTDRPVVFEDILTVKGDLLYIDIHSSMFNSSLSTIVLPVDLSGIIYNSQKIYFKPKDTVSFFNEHTGLSYNYPYYLKRVGNSYTVIELYTTKKLLSKINFNNGGSGTHQLILTLNPYKFDIQDLLPYNRTYEDLNLLISEVFNYLIQVESENPDAHEKIVSDITNKYTSYFDLSDDIVTQLISESGYNYLTEIGLDLGTFELPIFYSYLRLFHLLKGKREGLEMILQLLGYEAKLIEWWEMVTSSFYLSTEPNTFDILIKIVDKPTLTIEQIQKIRTFTRYYVIPILRYIIQDILFEFANLGIGTAGYSDKLFIFETAPSSMSITLAGFHDIFYDVDMGNPNF